MAPTICRTATSLHLVHSVPNFLFTSSEYTLLLDQKNVKYLHITTTSTELSSTIILSSDWPLRLPKATSYLFAERPNADTHQHHLSIYLPLWRLSVQMFQKI